MCENKSCLGYIENFIEPHLLSGMPIDEGILLGLSGGADSSLLLEMLVKFREKTGAPLYAAHVEHGIRGDEALRDLEFCRRLCLQKNVEFFEVSVDVPKLAKLQKKSLELCARDVRYDFFDKIMREKGIRIIATAHNADDNMETLLFNIMRGAGIHGASGIPPSRPFGKGMLIRPLLNIEKANIIKYCNSHKIEFVIDSTNEQTEYSRNFIRAKIVPLLRQCNPYVGSNITRFCEIMRKNADFIDKAAIDFIKANLVDGKISSELLNKTDEALLMAIISQMYKMLCGDALEYTHLQAITEQIYSGKPHFSVDLPNDVKAVNLNRKFCFEYSCNKNAKQDYNIKVTDLSKIYYIGNFAVEFCCGNNNFNKIGIIDKNIYKLDITTYINFGNIEDILFLRNRCAGDVICINSMHKKIKKLFCEYNVPIEIRDSIPLLCTDNEILWAPFVGVCDKRLSDLKDKDSYCVRLWILQKRKTICKEGHRKNYE